MAGLLGREPLPLPFLPGRHGGHGGHAIQGMGRLTAVAVGQPAA